MSDKIRLFVGDDHPIVREGLIAVLETQSDFEVVGEGGNGEEILTKIEAHKPDILLLDLAMPKLDGLGVIEAMNQKGLSTKVIVFTAFDTDERIMGAIRAGAKGYLLKGVAREEIFQAIRIVHSGQSLIQPVVADKLFKHIREGAESLTKRELEVLHGLGQGKTNKEIAEALFISERTVKFHVSAILSKLNAQNRTEAVQIGVKKGYISFD